MEMEMKEMHERQQDITRINEKLMKVGLRSKEQVCQIVEEVSQ